MERTVLWLGAPSYRARLTCTPFSTRLREVSRGPDVRFYPGEEWGEALADWLAGGSEPGGEVDLVYQHHLLEIETFPRLPEADRSDALGIRMRRDYLEKPGELLSHVVWRDAAGQTQALFAAVLEETHQALCVALARRGFQVGRVGFAGQIALLELDRQAARGGFAILENMAGSPTLLLARDAEGLLMAAGFPRDAEAAAPERLALWQSRRSQPIELFELSRTVPAARGTEAALPPPLDALIVAFANRKRWRMASRRDLDYPLHFSVTTWAAAAVSLGLLLHAGSLALEARRLSVSSVEQAALEREFRTLLEEAKGLARRQAGLEILERQIRGLEAEPFDNAGWMRFVGEARDRCASTLLFDSISVRAAQMTLSGAQDRVEPVLRLYECLATALGDAAVKLARLETEVSGRSAFVLEIERQGPRPPRLPGATQGLPR